MTSEERSFTFHSSLVIFSAARSDRTADRVAVYFRQVAYNRPILIGLDGL
ncbi:MAG: hypothetical protein KA765_09680 [Thermoflexales bacterium]|nr:hypothetical protein [Thermoflexales bacterium]